MMCTVSMFMLIIVLYMTTLVYNYFEVVTCFLFIPKVK